jgi:hypothetical protein
MPEPPADRLTRFWWGRLPAVAYRLSPQLGIWLADGIHLATWRAVSSAGPRWAHPGFPTIWSQSVAFMTIVAVLGTVSAALGAYFVAGFAAGDFALAAHGWPAVVPAAAPGVFGADLPAPVRLRLPLLIGYLLLVLLAVRIPVLTKNLLAEAANRGGRSRRGPPVGAMALAVAAHAVVTGALVWAWVQAVPVLIRPRFTWLGSLAPPADAVGPLQAQGDVVVVAAMAASIARMVHQFPLALEGDVQARFDAIQEPVLSTARSAKPPGAARLWLRAVAGSVTIVLVSCGILANAAEALVVLGAAVALYAARSGLVRIPLGGWPDLVQRVPLALRLLAAWIVIQWLAGQLLGNPLVTGGANDLFRPFVVTTLLALVIVYLLAPYAGQAQAQRRPT